MKFKKLFQNKEPALTCVGIVEEKFGLITTYRPSLEFFGNICSIELSLKGKFEDQEKCLDYISGVVEEIWSIGSLDKWLEKDKENAK